MRPAFTNKPLPEDKITEPNKFKGFTNILCVGCGWYANHVPDNMVTVTFNAHSCKLRTQSVSTTF